MPSEYFIYFGFILLYALCMMAIAYFCRKRSTSLDNFYLAGKGIGPWMTAFAYGTTYFSSVVLIGYAGKLGASFGLGVLWIGIGNAFIGTYLSWKILAKRTKLMTSAMKAKTMPEFFEGRYKNPKVKLVTAIIIGVFLIPYSASVYQGLGHLFAAVFGIDTASQETIFIICVLALASITALYVFFGGYFATALSDFIQGIIMLVGVVVMVVLVYNHVGGFSSAFTRLEEASLNFIPKGTSAFDIFCLVILTSLGTWALPQIIHKFYAIKDDSAVKRGTVVSVIFCTVVGICAYAAGASSSLFGEEIGFADKVADGNFDSIMPAIFTTALPPVVIGLMIIMVLSASMSTLASLSLSCSSAVTIDIYAGYIKKDIEDKKLNMITRFASIFFIALSAVIAIFKPAGIVELMGFSWGTLAGCFIGPYLYGLFMKKSNIYGTWASIIATLLITAVLIFVPGFGINKSPLIGVICMFTSLIITPIVSLVTAKRATAKNLDYEYAELNQAEKVQAE